MLDLYGCCCGRKPMVYKSRWCKLRLECGVPEKGRENATD